MPGLYVMTAEFKSRLDQSKVEIQEQEGSEENT